MEAFIESNLLNAGGTAKHGTGTGTGGGSSGGSGGGGGGISGVGAATSAADGGLAGGGGCATASGGKLMFLQNKTPKWDEAHGGHVLNFQV